MMLRQRVYRARGLETAVRSLLVSSGTRVNQMRQNPPVENGDELDTVTGVSFE